jgi:hypothetical protein
MRCARRTPPPKTVRFKTEVQVDGKVAAEARPRLQDTEEVEEVREAEEVAVNPMSVTSLQSL